MLDRPLHLPLRRVAVACQRLLDAFGRKVDHRDILKLGGKAYHSAGVPHQNRGAREGSVRINLLKAERLRLEFSDDFLDAVEKSFQAHGQPVAGFASRPNDARFHQPHVAVPAINDAIAGGIEAGVNSQYARGHAERVRHCIRF